MKKSCYEMRCEVGRSEDRKLDRATFYGVKSSIWAGGSYRKWLRRVGGLLNSSLNLRSAAFQQASGLRDAKSGISFHCYKTLLAKGASALHPILFLESGQFSLFPPFLRDCCT